MPFVSFMIFTFCDVSKGVPIVFHTLKESIKGFPAIAGKRKKKIWHADGVNGGARLQTQRRAMERTLNAVLDRIATDDDIVMIITIITSTVIIIIITIITILLSLLDGPLSVGYLLSLRVKKTYLSNRSRHVIFDSFTEPVTP